MDPLSILQKEWPVISSAPWSVATIIVICAGIGFWVGRFFRAEAVSNLQSRIVKRDEEIAAYKSKLEGKSPDEAANQVEELRSQLEALNALQPWSLKPAQLAAMASRISNTPRPVRIARYVGSAGLEIAQSQLVAVFNGAKWSVEHHESMGKPNEPHHNITLLASPDADRDTLHILQSAFKSAGVDYSEQAEQTNDTVPMIWLAAARTERY